MPTDKGANAGLKIASLVAGMVAGADAIDDMAVLRHGGMRKLFAHLCAPSTIGSFLRAFTFGPVRRLGAVASRFLINLAAMSPLISPDPDDHVLLDVDDTIIEVLRAPETRRQLRLLRGPRAQRDPCHTEIGHRRADHSRPASSPGCLFVPARRDPADPWRPRHSPPPAWDDRRPDLVPRRSRVLHLRGHPRRPGSRRGRLCHCPPRFRRQEAIKYTHAIFDEDTRTWISDAEFAEIPYTAFTSRKKSDHISGRLVVRRIPELNKHKLAGQATLFDLHRFHAFFTTSTQGTVT